MVLPNALWPDARPPRGLNGGAGAAAADLCEVGPFARVAAIRATDSPNELRVRCVYTVFGWPVMTGWIFCLDGRWAASDSADPEGKSPGGCT